MILHTQTPVVDETDGLPLPHRIWAVVGISFALCMSVLDINIINVVLPTLSHDFGTSPAVTTWIINGYQLAIVILFAFILVTGRNLWIPQNISFRNSYVHRHFPDLRFIPFILDIDHCPHFPGIQLRPLPASTRLSYVRIYPRKQIGRGMGINAMVVGHIGSSRPSGMASRNSICRFLALAIRYQRPSRISCPDFGIKVPAPKRGTFEQKIRQAECHSQCNHLRAPDLYFGWICPPRKQ